MSALKLILILAALVTASCADSGGNADTVNAGFTFPERPTADAIILSRKLPFQNDERVSYCEVLAVDSKSYSGFRDQALYPLASLSKVITTAWALKKLGPDYSFQSTWYLKPVAGTQGSFDAYLKTNYDPVFNLDKILYSLSLLNEKGVKLIRNLIIDETTRVYLSVLAQPHMELENVPVSSDETRQNLQLILNSSNWSAQTQNAKIKLQSWASVNDRSLHFPDQFTVEQVIFKKSNQINLSDYTNKVSINSSPLLKYLKNVNVYSNNYITDALFSFLGGASEFQKFQRDELKLSADNLKFYSGSGLAENVNSVRLDNLGSCYSLLKVFNYVDRQAGQAGLNLGHFLYNPTTDLDGTFESKFKFSNQIVFKTGRLFENPALNLAGIISTNQGSLYFAFLGHGFSDNESSEIESERDQLLSSTLSFYATKNSFLTLRDYQILFK